MESLKILHKREGSLVLGLLRLQIPIGRNGIEEYEPFKVLGWKEEPSLHKCQHTGILGSLGKELGLKG